MELAALPRDILNYLFATTFFGSELGLVLVRLNLASKFWRHRPFQFVTTLRLGAHHSDGVDPRNLPTVRTLILTGYSYKCPGIPFRKEAPGRPMHLVSPRYRILTSHGGLLSICDLRIVGTRIKAGALSRLHHLRSLTALQIASSSMRTNVLRKVSKLTQLRILQLDRINSQAKFDKVTALTNLRALAVPSANWAGAEALLAKLPSLETIQFGSLRLESDEIKDMRPSPRLARSLVGSFDGRSSTFLGECISTCDLTQDILDSLIKVSGALLAGVDIHGSPGSFAGRLRPIPPIFVALIEAFNPVPLITKLLDAGADVNGRVPGSSEPDWSFPTDWHFSHGPNDERPKAFQLLLQRGFDVGKVPLHGIPHLHFLAQGRQADLIGLALAHTPTLPVNTAFNENTALGLAGDRETAMILLKAKANPWQQITERQKQILRHPINNSIRGRGRGMGLQFVVSRRRKRGLHPPFNFPRNQPFPTEMMTPAHVHATSGIIEVFQHLLAEKIPMPKNLAPTEPGGYNLLHCASMDRRGHMPETVMAVLDYLVWNFRDQPEELKAYINATSTASMQPLQLIVANIGVPTRRFELLTRLESLGADLNYSGRDHSPLYNSLVLRDYGCASFLIDKGARIDAGEYEECLSPLALIVDQQAGVPNQLKDHFYKLYAQDINKYSTAFDMTPVHVALIVGSGAPAVTDLLQRGADLTLPNYNGDIPVSFYAQGLRRAGDSRLQMLIEAAPQTVNFSNVNGVSLLHHAISSEMKEPVQYLLSHPYFDRKRFASQLSVFGTPLHLATRQSGDSNFDVIDLLLEAGADINQVFDYGLSPDEETALLATAPPLAARVGCVFNNRTIVIPSRDVEYPSHFLRWDPYRQALRGRWRMHRNNPLRRDAGRGVTLLFLLDSASIPFIQALKARGCNLELKNTIGMTALANAALTADFAAFGSLLGAGADWKTTIGPLIPVAAALGQCGSLCSISLVELVLRLLCQLAPGHSEQQDFRLLNLFRVLLRLFASFTKDELWSQVKDSTAVAHHLVPASVSPERFQKMKPAELARDTQTLPPLTFANWQKVVLAVDNARPGRYYEGGTPTYLRNRDHTNSAKIIAVLLLPDQTPADITAKLVKSLVLPLEAERSEFENDLADLLTTELHFTPDLLAAIRKPVDFDQEYVDI